MAAGLDKASKIVCGILCSVTPLLPESVAPSEEEMAPLTCKVLCPDHCFWRPLHLTLKTDLQDQSFISHSSDGNSNWMHTARFRKPCSIPHPCPLCTALRAESLLYPGSFWAGPDWSKCWPLVLSPAWELWWTLGFLCQWCLGTVFSFLSPGSLIAKIYILKTAENQKAANTWAAQRCTSRRDYQLGRTIKSCPGFWR